MNTNQAVGFILSKEIEMSNHVHNSVTELLRLGIETDRGNEEMILLIKALQHSIDDIKAKFDIDTSSI